MQRTLADMTTPATLPNFTDAIQERAVLAAGISNASERFRYLRNNDKLIVIGSGSLVNIVQGSE